MFDRFTDLSNYFNEARNFGNENWRLGKPNTWNINENTALTVKKLSVGNWCFGASGWGVTFRIRF